MQIPNFVPLLLAYAVIVALFIKNRRDMKRIRKESQETVRTATTPVANLAMEVQGIRHHIEEFPMAPVAHGQSINLTRRAQVLRMYRRGESVPSIAAALRAPSSEVQLVLKLHHLLHTEN